MKLGVGLWAVSVVLLAFSCGTSESDDDTGAGGKGMGGASATGAGGKSAAGGGDPTAGRSQVPGMGGTAAGSSEQSGAGGTGNTSGASGAGGSAAQGGTRMDAAGAGASDAQSGQAGSGDTAGASGAGGSSAKGSLTMFVMFDRSWSMRECGDGNTSQVENNTLECDTLSRWDLTSAALIQFFQDPAAAGLNVALRFFPHDEPAAGCDGYPSVGTIPPFPGSDAGAPDAGEAELNCDIDACSEPLVPAGRLTAAAAPTDTQETALVNAIQASVPPGPEMPNPQPGTPTSAALAGAESWATAYRAEHPDEPLVVVLVTDGEAQGCDTDTTHIADLAAVARDSAGVLTYAIGLSGSSEASLDRIAEAGGTERAFFVSDGSTAVQDLFEALSTIRSGAH